MNFKEMISLKIEEQRAAMAALERVKRSRDLTVREKLTIKNHSEVVLSLELARENLNWLDQYGK